MSEGERSKDAGDDRENFHHLVHAIAHTGGRGRQTDLSG